MSDLEKRKNELDKQIRGLMEKIMPLKKELEAVTEDIYILFCQKARSLPVWELRINPAKTLKEARRQEKFTLCSNVTWQQMYDTAVQYFSENGISNWIMNENPYKDCGQFCYEDGYNGSPILGVFEMIGEHPHIVREFDFEDFL